MHPAEATSLRQRDQPSILLRTKQQRKTRPDAFSRQYADLRAKPVSTLTNRRNSRRYRSWAQKRQKLPGLSTSMHLPRTRRRASGSTSPLSQTKRKLCGSCRVVNTEGLRTGQARSGAAVRKKARLGRVDMRACCSRVALSNNRPRFGLVRPLRPLARLFAGGEGQRCEGLCGAIV